MSFFEEQHRSLSRDRKKLIEYNKNLLYIILKANNIKTVLVEFDGSADSGSIDSVHLSKKSYDDMGAGDDEDCSNILEEVFIGSRISTSVSYSHGKNPELEVEEGDSTVEGVITSICYNLIEIEHPGWENNDGAYGEFVFDIENDKINYTHNTRIMDVESHEHSY